VATPQQVKCKAAGKPLDVLKFDTDPEALLQVKQGRAVADMNDFPVAAYNVSKSSDFEVVGDQIEAGPYGIGVRKEDAALRDALQKAVQALIDSGAYSTILEKWKVTAGAVTTAAVNGGT
jgi:polar amino acid transport system substrate-binding protein